MVCFLLCHYASRAQQIRIYNGIDLSHHNNVCWDSIHADPNILFCYIKATEGVHFFDPMSHHHYLGATAGNLHVGFYHYFRCDVSGKKQYQRFKQVLDYNPDYDLIPVIDIERSYNDLSDTAQLNTNLRQFVRAFEQDFGFHPILYYCDYTPIHKVISHPELYCKWVPRWRLNAVSSHIDIYQNFVRRIGNVPIDFDYCPDLNHIILPEHLPCWHFDVMHNTASCQHYHYVIPYRYKHFE